MGQRMLVREGEIGHRIEIQIFFEYIYIFVLVTFYLMKRERLLLKPEKKYVTDAKDESYPRFWITILDQCFPIRRISILKKCRKLVSRSYYYYYSFYLGLQILSIFRSVLLDA